MSILSRLLFIFDSRSRLILILTMTLILVACSSVPSITSLIGGRHKYDHAQNFESMKKYDFSPISSELKANPDFKLLQQSGGQLAIENIMATKKISKERHTTPDFWLNYYYTGEHSITVGGLNKFFNYNLGLAWDDKYGMGNGIANTSHNFSSGTLIIDLVSKHNNKLIWRGSAPVNIDKDDTYDEKRQALQKSVSVIMSPFPPENNFSSLKQAVPE